MYKILVGLLMAVTLLACSEKSGGDAYGANSGSGAAEQQAVEQAGKTPMASAEAAKVSAPLVAPPAGKYVAGTHYRVLDRPLPTSNPNKVEIAEFFWYGCGHCYTFETLLQPYKRNLHESIEFVGIPAMWRDVMTVHAKAYYAAKTLKNPALHEAMFVALNVDRKQLASETAVAKLFAQHGEDQEKVKKLLSSFGVSAQVNKARSLGAGAKLRGTPTLMVNGKYVIGSSLAGSQAEMLKIADYLAKLEATR